MNKNHQLKAEKVKQLKIIFKDLQTVILFNNNSLNMQSIEVFRKEIKKYNATARIFKNRLLKRVFENTKLSDLIETLTGPMMFIYSNDDSLELIKKVYKLKKNNKNTKIIAGFYDQKKLNSSELDELSKLPTHLESLQYFVWLLKSPMSNFIITLKTLIEKKKVKI